MPPLSSPATSTIKFLPFVVASKCVILAGSIIAPYPPALPIVSVPLAPTLTVGCLSDQYPKCASWLVKILSGGVSTSLSVVIPITPLRPVVLPMKTLQPVAV